MTEIEAVNILDANHELARSYLLKNESYCHFDLPKHFDFTEIIDKTKRTLGEDSISGFSDLKALRGCDGANYTVTMNKDGKYAWRPFELITPGTVCGPC